MVAATAMAAKAAHDHQLFGREGNHEAPLPFEYIYIGVDETTKIKDSLILHTDADGDKEREMV